MSATDSVEQHYGRGGLMETIATALKLGDKDINSLTVDDLAPIDEFHSRGRESTVEMAQLAALSSEDHMLDVGCGLGGSARHLAEQYKCKVTGIDLTNEYIEVGMKLTGLVGLSEQVLLREPSALELPFENESFDVVWTEHAQMNIADKELFYSEIARVLKPKGRLLFHDIFRGTGEAPKYPAPWAEDASISHLATEPETRNAIESAGLSIADWNAKKTESIEFFRKVSDPMVRLP